MYTRERSLMKNSLLITLIIFMLFIIIIGYFNSLMKSSSTKIPDLTEAFSYEIVMEINDPILKNKYSNVFQTSTEEEARIYLKGIFINALMKHKSLTFKKNSGCKTTDMSIISGNGHISCLEEGRFLDLDYNARPLETTCPEMTITNIGNNQFSISNIKGTLSDNYPGEIISCSHAIIFVSEHVKWRYSINDRADKIINWAHYKSDKQMEN